jgi:hypothetical protein
MSSKDNTLCAFCDVAADLPYDQHPEWCEHKIFTSKINRVPVSEVEILKSRLTIYERKIAEYESALRLIGMSKRPDGTYNRCREACEHLAKETLKKFNR